jgi:hypothetical protein
MPSYGAAVGSSTAKPKAEAPAFSNPFSDFDFSKRDEAPPVDVGDTAAAEAKDKAEKEAAEKKKAEEKASAAAAEKKKAEEKARAEKEEAEKKADKEANEKKKAEEKAAKEAEKLAAKQNEADEKAAAEAKKAEKEARRQAELEKQRAAVERQKEKDAALKEVEVAPPQVNIYSVSYRSEIMVVASTHCYPSACFTTSCARGGSSC